MEFTPQIKESIKREILQCLSSEKEIKKIIIFGSFLQSETPNDIDIAVFEDSNASYLTLAMKYRRLIRKVARKIPVDIFPVRANASDCDFLAEIKSGELIYEK